MATGPLQEFRRAVGCAEAQLDLARATLVIARGEYPELEVDSYLARLDLLAEQVKRYLDATTDPYRSIAAELCPLQA